MRSYARIVVEEQDVNQWTAWIVGSADLAVQGRSLGNALTNILLEFGVEEFEVKNLSMDRDATREGHLEFCVPLRRRRQIPVTSSN